LALLIPDIVVVDVETTGMAPPGHRVIEIGAVRLRYTEERRRLSTLLNPGRYIPNRITSLTGIDGGMLRDAPLFEDIATVLWDFMDGAVFCAHNAGFDARFLRYEFSQWGAVPPALEEDTPSLCTMRLGRRLMPYLPNHKLDTLAGYMEIDFSARHRALGDALATAEIFRRFLVMIYRQGIKDLQEILKLQQSRIPRNFKKPQGTSSVS